MKEESGKTLLFSLLLLMGISGNAAAQEVQKTSPWYVGVQGGVPFGASTFSSFGADKTRAGFTGGLNGGYRFNPLLSAEVSMKWGKTALSAQDCCIERGYWLGADGNRYDTPLSEIKGYSYADVMSRVSLQQYGLHLHVNMLGLFASTRESRWSLNLSPAHYGVQKLSVDTQAPKQIEVKMNRILAELQFTIKGAPAEIVKVDAKLTNAAKSFLPYSGQLLPDIDIADLGSAVPQNGVISFPMKRVMPIVAPAEGRAEVEVKTRLQFTFHYKDGSTTTCDATAPAIENGGSYTPEVIYDLFRPGIEITITDINGWIKGETSGGEILNPSL